MLKINDVLAGALLGLLAGAVLFAIRNYPKIPGQNVGPSAFPGLIATLLLVCAVALMVRGWVRRERGAAWVGLSGWVRSLPHARNFAVTVAALLFYITFSERLGFLVCGVLVLVALFLSLGVRRLAVLPLAVAVTLAIHAIFYIGLRVPLPWGVLEPLVFR